MAFEKPLDRLVTDRAQVFSGWFEARERDFLLRAHCGRVEVRLAEFRHPDRVARTELRGFWGILRLQDCLPGPGESGLDLEFRWSGRRVAEVPLRVSPLAVETARRCPLSGKRYPVSNRGRRWWSQAPPRVLIFPGLGGVGGSSINALMRTRMLEEGWEVPIRGDANDPELWAALGRAAPSRARWIDGHDCYAAGAFVEGPFARITVMREPAARLVSLFNWGSLVHPLDFPHATFEEFLASGDAKKLTLARGLLRLAGWTPSADATDEEIHREAAAELRRSYALVGFTEHFDETLFLLAELAGHSELGMWWRELSAPSFVRLDSLSQKAAGRLEEIVAVDRRLYESSLRDFLEILRSTDFGEPLNEYKRDSADQSRLTEAEKLAECLRWRQLLAEDELRWRRSRQSGEVGA